MERIFEMAMPGIEVGEEANREERSLESDVLTRMAEVEQLMHQVQTHRHKHLHSELKLSFSSFDDLVDLVEEGSNLSFEEEQLETVREVKGEEARLVGELEKVTWRLEHAKTFIEDEEKRRREKERKEEGVEESTAQAPVTPRHRRITMQKSLAQRLLIGSQK